MNPLIGTRIDHYDIQALLGEGGMGAVYRAYDLNLARPVALKVMHQQLAGQPEFQARFMQEAQSAARLSHPSIVTIHYFGANQGLLYMVMAYISGGSLSAHLSQLKRKGEVVQLREILTFLAQVADALGYAHKHGVIHRDIKPSNVLVQQLEAPEREGDQPLRAVVTDFGLAKLLSGGLETRSDMLLGTYPYMSPEQCLQKPYDGRSDLYSLGVMLYQLLTGKLPYDIRSATDAVLKHHTKVNPVPPRQACPELPVMVEQIINKAIAREPEERYQTGEAIAVALREAARSLPEEDITQFESLGTVKSLSTSLESAPPHAEPSRMGFEIPAAISGDRLIIAQKEHTPRSIPLNKTPTMIGRIEGNEIVLDDKNVSRRHARLDRTATGWQVTDLGSTNRTYLEGQPLLPDVPEDFLPGKTLRIGPFYLHWQSATVNTATEGLLSSKVTASRLSNMQNNGWKIDVVVQPPHVEIMPGNRLQIQVALLNENEFVEHLELHLEGIPTAWFTLPNPRLDLMPGEKGFRTFDIHPPLDYSASEGLHHYQLIVTSDTNQNVSVKLPGEIFVKPFERFSVEIQPSQLSHGGTAQVAILNQGNTDGNYNLRGHDAANAVRYIGLPATIQVARGENNKPPTPLQVPVQVSAINRPLIGTRQTLPFEIEVTSGTSSQQVLRGQLQVMPVIPIWLLSLFIVLCTFCLLSGPPVYNLAFAQPRQTAFARATNQVQTTEAGSSSLTSTALFQQNATSAAGQTTAIASTNIALTSSGLGDDDGDGLTNQYEQEHGLNPDNPDMDQDGLKDGEEVNQYGTNPQNQDSDADNLKDGDEVLTYKTSPMNPDTDNDGIKDGVDPDPLATPTATPAPPTDTPSPTPTALIDGYGGTWYSSRTDAGTLISALYRVKVEFVDPQANTAKFSVCRCLDKNSCKNGYNLTPLDASAHFDQDKKLVVEPVYIDEQRKVQWRLKAFKVNESMRVTVEQYDEQGNKVGGPEDFLMDKPKNRFPDLGNVTALDACQPPPRFALPE
jgi:eukaryotic-like serine/threonine-protein kinase